MKESSSTVTSTCREKDTACNAQAEKKEWQAFRENESDLWRTMSCKREGLAEALRVFMVAHDEAKR
jgi:hypothetical protein